MLRDRSHRIRLGIMRWYAAARGYRIYALALVLAVPDVLDALAGVDFTVLLPPGWGAKAASILAIARVVLGVVIRRLAMVGPPPAAGPR
ncbi:hypothetical protein [Methylobacterium sp. 285MFTsu5.1]|uniref:hypothetical protein n=1 Tax=Methylobacterium sp. 285MFTsu5.1 TaxID=1172187 RepID=UPI000370358B|nr:hypothetical protein [Methylobacterium sp. 285MFTsu5.1]